MATNKTILNIEINQTVNDYLTAVQQDSRSRFLDIMLFDNGVPINLTGHTVRLYAIKPDGKEVYNNGTITDAKNGRMQFELTSQTLAVAGVLNLQVITYKNNTEILSTNPFKLFILESLMSSSSIQSSNEYGALVVTLRDLESAKALMQEMVTKIGTPGPIANSLNLKTMYAIMDEILKMLRDSSVVAIKNKLDKIDTTTTNTNAEIPNLKQLIQDTVEQTKKTYLDLYPIIKKTITIASINGTQQTTVFGSSNQRVIHVVGKFMIGAGEQIRFKVRDNAGNSWCETVFTAPDSPTTNRIVYLGYVNAQHLSTSAWAYATDERSDDSDFSLQDPLGLRLPRHSALKGFPSVTGSGDFRQTNTQLSSEMNLVAYYTKTNYYPNRKADNLKVEVSGTVAKGGEVYVYVGRDS